MSMGCDDKECQMDSHQERFRIHLIFNNLNKYTPRRLYRNCADHQCSQTY